MRKDDRHDVREKKSDFRDEWIVCDNLGSDFPVDEEELAVIEAFLGRMLEEIVGNKR